ncbi:short-chain dehydrogenase reductase ATA1-like [Cynara cardunculus var. scolymus]|uniref:short-chain dehydrogenase reductase ATA1-like n=1 Tax=Cynara cardunculus var. scolymus TaxID=59895 RepID=UPI000D62D089|nr:short-chain dehydrogenase reductase ATA1-like [Cynara cardunculus var. scolymus]
MLIENNIYLGVTTNRLINKVAVVTGGARGIGGATAKLMAENGAHVVIADVLDDLGTNLANSINGRYVHCDVSVESDVEAAIQLAVTWKGKIDILFNNAGIGDVGGSICSVEMKNVAKLIGVNVNGVVHGIKHAARAMILAGNGGSIISSSSTAAIMGGLGSHAYTLSKEAILGVSRSSACELGIYGIRVNCVLPHGVLSEMLVDAYRGFKNDVTVEEVQQKVSENASLLKGRCGSVEDVAEAVLFLASDKAGFITGHNLVIDGGYTSSSIGMTFIYRDKISKSELS